MSEPQTSQDRQSALLQIVQLAEQFDLSTSEIAQALTRGADAAETSSSLLVKVLSYLGGTFIFAGIAIFIGLQWDSLNSAARVIVTLGTGLTMFTLAALAFRDERYSRFAMPLLLMSALLQPTGMMVAFAEFGGGGDERVAALLTALTFALQFGAAVKLWGHTIMAWLGIMFLSAAWGLGLDLMDLREEAIAISLGLGWLGLGVATLKSRHSVLSPQLFLIGCWSFLWGVFELVQGSVGEAVFIIAACAMVYLGVWTKSRILNLASTTAILAYTAYFTGTYFADSIGWPIALICIGVAMLGISTLAVKIDRNYLREA